MGHPVEYHCLLFRCNDTSKVNHYEAIAKKVQYAINDTEIFHLTGCLSKCNKYHFKAYARSELIKSEPRNTTELRISFRLPNGRSELREQVRNNVQGNYLEW